MCYDTKNFKDKCETYLKKYNQKILGSVFYFFPSDFSSCLLAVSSLFFNSDLTKNRGGEGRLAGSIGKTKTETSQALPVANLQSSLRNC